MSAESRFAVRGVDPRMATLAGEASHQVALERRGDAWVQPPQSEGVDYYGVPVLKAPVWKWYIPGYYFMGGMAGASLALGAAAQLKGRDLEQLTARAHWLGTIGSSLGGVLLILDLGRPMRFLAMMRVFRPTSPMNMGVWILGAAAPFGTSAALFCTSPGWLGVYGRAMSYAAGVFGLALSSYTGVLVGNTVVPVWYRSRRVLPTLFAASGLASAVSMLGMFEDRAAGRLLLMAGTAARVTELAAARVMEREAGDAAEPLRSGASGAMWKAAAVCTAASLVVSLLPVDRKWKRVTAGVLGLLGSALVRFAVHEAGSRSARDPQATFRDQRARLL